ncbi:MAG TPA: hypothetical protein PLM74_00630 [Bacillota bacterium]|nr:hypothetical protein [Bacillota bacterium]
MESSQALLIHVTLKVQSYDCNAAMPELAQMLNAKLGATVKQGAAKLYEKRGRWYLALSISVQVTPCVGTKVAGVDLGLANLAVVNCEGETLFFSGDHAAFVRRRFKALRRRMGKAKALGAIRRMKDKEARSSVWRRRPSQPQGDSLWVYRLRPHRARGFRGRRKHRESN